MSVLVATLVASGAARADEPAPETIYVVDERPEGARDRERTLGDGPLVTVLHPDEHAATSSVAEALATTAGVQTRSLGGLGAYQTISVRGATSGHTAVLVDGIPLARLAQVTTDLGRFSLASFGAVELYRGAVPVELGGAGVGGAVNMITRLGRGERGERITASLGYGSFGARHLRARYGDEYARLRTGFSVGYTGSDGDFTYFDDNGTLLNTNDDGYRTRANNSFEQIDASARIGATQRDLVGGVRIAVDRRGLPGTLAAPSETASLATANVLADVQGTTQLDAAALRNVGYVLVERQRIDDENGELGLGTTDRAYTTLSAGGSSTLRVRSFTAGVELRGDRFTDRDRTGAMPTVDGLRAGVAGMAALDLALAPQLTVTPAIRVETLYTDATPMSVGPQAGAPIPARTDVVPSPRLTARVALTDDVVVKASSGWYTRMPTSIEVFGNRGFILGSPDLRPERGPSHDLGVVWAPAQRVGIADRILVTGSVFANRSRDTIAFIAYAGSFASRAVNLDATQAYGAELTATARLLERISLTANYTRLVTEQLSTDPAYHGNAIPRRPGHLAYTRADVEQRVLGRVASIFVDASVQSESMLDQASLQRVPGRTLIGAGASTELAAGFSLSLQAANLTDRRIAHLPLARPPSPSFTEAATPLVDVTGFPLPGRSLYLSLHWTH